jgi:uncharacterized protein DUF5947
VANVQQFVRPREVAEEQCELCSAPIATDHRHLVEPAKRRLVCVCRGCATLLGNRDDNRYRAVPEYARRLENFHMTDAEWDAFAIRSGLRSSFIARQSNVSLLFYPGPAGPTESLLDLQAWAKLVANNSLLAELEPDSEALLINRVRNAREYFADRSLLRAGRTDTHQMARSLWRR